MHLQNMLNIFGLKRPDGINVTCNQLQPIASMATSALWPGALKQLFGLLSGVTLSGQYSPNPDPSTISVN